jgi:AcrR family transcriptional regulator
MRKASTEEAQRPTRRYEQRLRAETSAATRRRITEVTVDLHDSVGPAKTTVTEIARRAGVQRPTFYKHFPDDHSLFEACTTHWFAAHPPPAPDELEAIEELGQRVERGLLGLYRYYRTHESMFSHWLRDAELIPALAEFAETGYHDYLRSFSQALIPPRLPRDARRTVLLAAQFHTWRMLGKREGMRDRSAARLMANAVAQFAP